MAKSGKSGTGRNAPVNEINGYLLQLEQKLGREYSPTQRTVFIAAVAERHLAIEEAAGQVEEAQAGVLQGALDAVWNHIQGRQVPAHKLKSLRQQVNVIELPGSYALALVRLALEACLVEDNLSMVRQAALLDIEAATSPAPGYPEDTQARQAVWRQPGVASVIERQEMLLMHAHLPVFNEYMVDFIKNDARSKDPFRIRTTQFTLPTEPGETIEAGFQFPSFGNAEVGNSNILERLASMLGKLQNGNFVEELAKKANQAGLEKYGLVTSQAEKEHGDFLKSSMSSWKREQRTAFCALISERWLKEYESFSKEEDWGHPDQLQHALEAVWGHLEGRRLSKGDAKRYHKHILENAPDTEDFDAPLALAACEILDYTVDSCLEADNLELAVSTGMAACTNLAMMGQGRDYTGKDQAEEERLWQEPTIRQEITRQTALIQRIAPLTALDAVTIDSLRKS